MNIKNRRGVAYLAQAGIIAALYVTLTVTQQLLLPGSTSMAVQFRLSEFMTLLCVFMPSAIPGLTIGCLISNLFNASVLPLDAALGTAATLMSGLIMYACRNIRVKGVPLLSAVMPALFNGIIIGWQLEVFYIEGAFHLSSFLIQAGLVAAGELAVCLLLGLPFVRIFEKRISKMLSP